VFGASAQVIAGAWGCGSLVIANNSNISNYDETQYFETHLLDAFK